MPIYEYQCTNCDHRLEALQKISDDPLRDCPACQQDKLKKLVSAAAFRLKGSGWYETDFKTGNKKQLAESDSGSSPAKSESNTSEKKSSSDSSAAAKDGKAQSANASSGGANTGKSATS